jgi:MFS family permease
MVRTRWRAAFATADLGALHAAWGASSTGNWAFSVALAIYAYRVGGGPAVGLAAAVRMLPAAVASPFAGLLSDRHSRRAMLLAAAFGRATLLAAIATVVALGGPAPITLALAAAVTTVTTVQRPAQAALLTGLAQTPQELAAANVVWSALDNGGFLVGALTAGLVVAGTSAEAAFSLTAVAFAAAGVITVRITPDPTPRHRAPPSGSSVARETMLGLRTVWRDGAARGVVSLLGCAFLIEGCMDVLIVTVAFEVLQAGGSGLGWLNVGWGIGGLVGGSAASTALRGARLTGALAWGGLLMGGAVIGIAAVGSFVAAMALLAVLGLGFALIEVAGQTLLQRRAADEVLARAFGVVETSYWTLNATGAILAPALAAALGLRGALVVAGALLPVTVLSRRAALSGIESEAPAPERELLTLRRTEVLAPLPLTVLEALAREVATIAVRAGDVVIREGERGERFYVIVDGRFDVHERGVARRGLGPGDFFGEIALLRDVPRTATVTAAADGLLFALGRQKFLGSVSAYRGAARVGHAVAAARLEETHPA